MLYWFYSIHNSASFERDTEEQHTAISLQKNPARLINAYGTIECSQ